MTRKSPSADKVVPLKKSKCTNCGKPATAKHHPFCSGRCANLDLGRWLNGEYRIATEEVPGDGDFTGEGDG